MEVVEACSSQLTNAEVLEVAIETKQQLHSKMNRSKPINTLLYQTIKYLESVNTSQPGAGNVEALVAHCKGIGLTKAEILQILNTRPITPVEIQLVVEESEERLDEAKIDELISIIQANLPVTPNEIPAQTSPSKKPKQPT